MHPPLSIHVSIHFNPVMHLLFSSENKIDRIDEVSPCVQTSSTQPPKLEQLEMKMDVVGFQNMKACIEKVFKCSH